MKFEDLKFLSSFMSGLPTEGAEPVAQKGDNEREVGEVPAHLRSLWWGYCALVDRQNQMTKEHDAAHTSLDHTPRQCLEFHGKIADVSRRRNFLNELFWIELRAELKLEEAGDIGITEGWKVVVTDGEKNFSEALADLLGSRVTPGGVMIPGRALIIMSDLLRTRG